MVYLQRYQRHDCGHIITACNQPTTGYQGTQLRTTGYTRLPAEAGWRKVAHQPSDCISTTGKAQFLPQTILMT